MSTSPASSGTTAVPTKGRSPPDADSQSDEGPATLRTTNPAQHAAPGSYCSSSGSSSTLRVNAPSVTPTALVASIEPPSTSPSGARPATTSSFPTGGEGSSALTDLSSPHDLVPPSSSCSSTSSLSGLTSAFSHVDVDSDPTRSSTPSVALGIFQPPPQPGVHAPPKTNAHSKPVPQGHVPRPRNPYILYRMDVVARGLIQGEKKHQNISKVVSEMWNVLSVEEKAPYVAAAHHEKMEHKRLYPNYIYQPGTDRPKPSRPPRVHGGSKAADKKAASKKKADAAAAAQAARALKEGKGKADEHLRAAQELERAAEESEDDEDYQPTKKRSKQKGARTKASPPRPSSSSRASSSFSSQNDNPSDGNWIAPPSGSSTEYEQVGRKRRSNREPFGSLEGTESPAQSNRSRTFSESLTDVRSSVSGSYDEHQIEQMRMEQGFHVSYPAANAPRPEHAHGFNTYPSYPPRPLDGHQIHSNAPPLPHTLQHQHSYPPHAHQYPHPSQVYYAPYPNYTMPSDVQYPPPHSQQPGRMAPPSYPHPHGSHPASSSMPPFRSGDFQFLPTAEPSPLTPGFPMFNHRRGSSTSGPSRPSRRESSGFGVGFQEEETPRTAAFREAFLPRSPAFAPPTPVVADSSSAASPVGPPSSTDQLPSESTCLPSRMTGHMPDPFTRDALRPQTYPRDTTAAVSSMRQTPWHMDGHEMFPSSMAATASRSSEMAASGPSSSASTGQQSSLGPFGQPTQADPAISSPNIGLDLSTRRKGRPEPLAFPQSRPLHFRSLPSDPQAPTLYHQMNEVTPTQANFMAEYYTVPFDEGPAWKFDPDRNGPASSQAHQSGSGGAPGGAGAYP